MRSSLAVALTTPFVRFDPDTRAYITAVERADGQALEPGVRQALDTFVRGCKADGIWNAIKASCILAGARTLAGALVPLKGTAPTNYNFVSGDYNRKTGLVGDGSTKYLDSNRANNADPRDSFHLSVFASSATSKASVYIGAGVTTAETGVSNLGIFSGAVIFRNRVNATSSAGVATDTGFIGTARASSGSYDRRRSGVTSAATVDSQAPYNGNIGIFGAPAVGHSDGRLAYYSIGESLDLALLDARVTALITDINNALEPWNPSMLSPSMWLDASNINTISLDEINNVTQWADLSGNSFDVVPPTVNARPAYQETGLNGQPTIYFGYIDDSLSSAITNVSSQGNLFFAAVFEMLANDNAWRIIVGSNTSELNANEGALLLQRRKNALEIGCHNSGRDDTGSAFAVQVTDLSIPRIATLGRTGGTNGAGGTLTITATGPSQPTYITTATQSWATQEVTSRIQIGGRQQLGTGYSNSKISEVIVMNRNASTLEREKVEGYLAHKWGLVDSLPINHQFKNVTPYR